MARNRADYYHDENRRVRRVRPEGAGRRMALLLIDVVMVVVSVFAAVALLGGLLAKVVNPESTTLFVFAGLFYQIIYLVNIACALWWVVRWKRWFLLSLAMLLVGSGNIGLFYRSDIRQKSEEVVRTREDVKLVTYNVMNFQNGESGEDNFERVSEWLNKEGAQIVCLQEAFFSSSKSFGDFKDRLKKLGYGFFTNADPNNGDSKSGSGYAMFSTYPIVRHRVADADSQNVNGVWADVKIGRDTVRIFNLHLQSTGISNEERKGTLSHRIIDDSLAYTKLSQIAHKVVDNYRVRAGEARNVASLVEGSPYPVVVCGDFNDTPVSYTYGHLRSRELLDAYVEKGRGTEFTFKGLYNLFRIDYILPQKDVFEVKTYDSYDLDYSDHKPIVATIRPIEK